MAKHNIEPRGLTLSDALYYIGVSASWFQARRAELIEKLKFPQPHPITNRYDRKQIDQWMEETGNIKSGTESETDELLERARSGEY